MKGQIADLMSELNVDEHSMSSWWKWCESTLPKLDDADLEEATQEFERLAHQRTLIDIWGEIPAEQKLRSSSAPPRSLFYTRCSIRNTYDATSPRKAPSMCEAHDERHLHRKASARHRRLRLVHPSGRAPDP